jgi:sec-independent protein translocase protein TatA
MSVISILIGFIGGPELIVVGVLVVILFGGKKIPEMMKGLGKGIKEFKKTTEDNDIINDIKDISSEIQDVSAGVKNITNPANLLKKKK